MSKAGQGNYKGVNAQASVGLSLFLQYLRDPNFVYIHLEANDLEDFNLVFNDDKKIICESKYRNENFSYSQLKEVLGNIVKSGSLGDRDEILIICKNATNNFISEVRNTEFFEGLKDDFKKKGYSDTLVHLLPRVKFWVGHNAFEKNVIYSLFTELINIWVPAEEIERFVDNILIKNIYNKSATGGTYSRIEITKEMDAFKKEIEKSSDFFNEKVKKEKQFESLEKIVYKNKPITLGTRSISALSTRWDLMTFTMDRLKTRKDLDLEKWDSLWQLNTVHYFTFGIFDVFENNLTSEKNIQYILKYIKLYSKNIRGFYRSDYFNVDVVKILTKIIEKQSEQKFIVNSFKIIKRLISFNGKKYFYLRDGSHDRGEWEKGEFCKLLHKIYKLADEKLKQDIFELVISSFNVTEDDGAFSHYAPSQVFEILLEWLREDFVSRFSKIVQVFSNQYNKFYRKFSKKTLFKGWEHMGGGISFGGDYHVDERHFVLYVLTPSISEFYQKDPKIGWKFIKDKCISSTRRVSINRPDFLNRAVYEIVLSRYFEENDHVSREAFTILSEWLLSKRGIPHKSDFIYQALRIRTDNLEKKWKLVQVTLEAYKIPVNPFVEEIVTDLAKGGFLPAKKELNKWYSNKKYLEHSNFLGNNINNIKQLLESNFEQAVDLFQTYIGTEYFITGKKDRFQSYEVAVLLNQILKIDFNNGIRILKYLLEKPQLSPTEQTVFCYGIFDHHGNDSSDDVNLLLRVYHEIVNVFLNACNNDIEAVTSRISQSSAREGIVQFAGRLATHHKIEEALRIIEVFINDPDPYMPGQDPDDPEAKYNEYKRIIEKPEEPHSIASVRGWCGWELMKCAVLSGRPYLRKTIDLTKILSNDDNYYVVHMACLALSQLAKNRLTVLPENSDILFFNDDIETALKLSKEVEDIAFAILDKIKNAPSKIKDNVQKALIKSILQPFDSIRALNQKQAWYLMQTLANFPEETLKESAPLFIYYAEYRKDNYKNWKWSRPGLYDDLDIWDSKPFEELVFEKIRTANDRGNLFSFGSVCEKMIRDAKVGSEDGEQNIVIALKYFRLLSEKYDHRVFMVIYMAIREMLVKKPGSSEWYALYINCLKVESDYYKITLADKKTSQEETYRGMYWWPYMDNFELLDIINKTYGYEKLITAAQLIFSFPKNFEIHETTSVIELLCQNKKDPRVKRMLKTLFDKNPSKYYNLKN